MRKIRIRITGFVPETDAPSVHTLYIGLLFPQVPDLGGDFVHSIHYFHGMRLRLHHVAPKFSLTIGKVIRHYYRFSNSINQTLF